MNIEKFVSQDEEIVHVFRPPESAISITGMRSFQRDLLEVQENIKVAETKESSMNKPVKEVFASVHNKGVQMGKYK